MIQPTKFIIMRPLHVQVVQSPLSDSIVDIAGNIRSKRALILRFLLNLSATFLLYRCSSLDIVSDTHELKPGLISG